VTDLRMALLELLSKYKDEGQLDALREGVVPQKVCPV